MSLFKCNECKKMISDTAVVCPHCGADVKNMDKGLSILSNINLKGSPIFLGLFIFLVIFYNIKNCSNSNEQKQIVDNERREFISNIDRNYNEIVELDKLNNYKQAVEKANKFKNYEQMNYKDISVIYKKNRTKELLENLKKTDKRQISVLIDIYKELSILNPNDKLYSKKKIDYEKKGQRIELIKTQFNDWDNSHKVLTAYIKLKMNDPNSYEHVETNYADIGNDKILIVTKFRGTNKFGGKVTNKITAEAKLNGQLVSIVSWE